MSDGYWWNSASDFFDKAAEYASDGAPESTVKEYTAHGLSRLQKAGEEDMKR